MRIALILAGNLYMAPYVEYYTDILNRCGISYDIITWNRFGVSESGTYAFDLKSDLHQSIFGKIWGYFRYRQFIKSKLAESNYDKIIVFTIFNALMIWGILRRKYRGNYILDIRDYDAAVKYLPSRFKAVIRNAARVVISSAGFKQWLPQHDYVIGHNTALTEPQTPAVDIRAQQKYKVLTIGAIGYYDANRRLIESLADDPKFDLEFAGVGYADQMLRDYVADKKISNVVFTGRYAKKDEPNILKQASLNGILINDSINSLTCMANRFYLSLIYGIPMLVDENTEQAGWVKKYSLGVVVGRTMNIKAQILHYFHNYDNKKFDIGRKECLQVIKNDVEKFEAELKTFLRV